MFVTKKTSFPARIDIFFIVRSAAFLQFMMTQQAPFVRRQVRKVRHSTKELLSVHIYAHVINLRAEIQVYGLHRLSSKLFCMGAFLYRYWHAVA